MQIVPKSKAVEEGYNRIPIFIYKKLDCKQFQNVNKMYPTQKIYILAFHKNKCKLLWGVSYIIFQFLAQLSAQT